MKLIIDVPDNWEEELNKSLIIFADVVDIDSIRNGIPLYELRSEIEQKWKEEPCAVNHGCLREILDIIDKYEKWGNRDDNNEI